MVSKQYFRIIQVTVHIQPRPQAARKGRRMDHIREEVSARESKAIKVSPPRTKTYTPTSQVRRLGKRCASHFP